MSCEHSIRYSIPESELLKVGRKFSGYARFTRQQIDAILANSDIQNDHATVSIVLQENIVLQKRIFTLRLTNSRSRHREESDLPCPESCQEIFKKIYVGNPKLIYNKFCLSHLEDVLSDADYDQLVIHLGGNIININWYAYPIDFTFGGNYRRILDSFDHNCKAVRN